MSNYPDFVKGFTEPPVLAPFKVSDMSGTFYLAGLSEVKKANGALHFMARTYSDDDNQRCGVAYYLNKRVLEQAQSPRDILKLVLKNLFKEIDRGYFDPD